MPDATSYFDGSFNGQQQEDLFQRINAIESPVGVSRGKTLKTDGYGRAYWGAEAAPGSESEANANIAPLEEGPTASQAYAVGDLMVYQGQLMTVVQAIAEGGAITPGTNVMSYTVAQALMSKVPVYGMGKNLLRNAYFVGGGSQQGGQFPINQRGQTSYTGAGYTIDGWYATGDVSLSQDGLYISDSVFQRLDNTAQLSGKVLTFSVLDTNGTLYSGTATFANATTDCYFSGTTLLYNAYWQGFQIILPGSTLQAAKLESGPIQTLAHQENGVWVLNEVPDYEEELIKCQTSKADASDSYANKDLATQQQLATVETTSTASRAYAVGEYLCYNGLLYRVTVAISAGGTITPGTNVLQSSVGAELENKANILRYHLNAGESVEINTGAGQFCVLVTHTAQSAAGTKGLYAVGGYYIGSNRRTVTEIVHSSIMTIAPTDSGFSITNTMQGEMTAYVIVIAGSITV